ncbi:putative baseplate assembly protein [Paenibacillus glycinis]|uniref:Baseplate assembly protein n=1 Tax=Paenibacillus glycinis TaxID=2697035 RepID=A0ABW9XIE1_9BACL|nr:putative baseplate assembly protein [Paenibacillus glycinis]NBD22293.1 putative baseplate assembly protein [Paenibacillus glycinis]
MLPLPKLDDRTYAQLVEDAIKRIPRQAPVWTDHNAHDPGITLIELFAWLTEQQHYYLDQIRSDNELKFLKLLGQQPSAAKPASAQITVSHRPGSDASVLIPAHTSVTNREGDVAFETEAPLLATAVKLRKIISMPRAGVADYSEANIRAGMHFAAFGKKAEAGSRLYLGFDRPFPAGERIPIAFELFDRYPVAGNPVAADDRCLWIRPSAEIAWEYYSAAAGGSWLPLVMDADETLRLTFSGSVIFTAPADALNRKIGTIDEELYWIRATVKQAGYELPPKLERILLNTVPVVQRATVKDEPVGSSNGLPEQYFDLTRFPVLPESLHLLVEEKTDTGTEWIEWKRVDTLDASRPTDKHYLLLPDSGRILFGDGVNGAIPQPAHPKDAITIKAACYQTTMGVKGNVGAAAITRWVDTTSAFDALELTNWLPAAGGAPQETIEQAQVRTRKQLQSAHSAATSEDYEAMALSTPGLRVARAKAIPLQDRDGKPAPGVVMVVVVPYGESANPVPSPGFLSTVCRHLHPHRLLTTRLRVVAPDYAKASVEADIEVQSGYDAAATKQKAIDALLHYLHPLIGGNDGTGWPFGRPIYVSEIYDVVKRSPGVDRVHRVRIAASGKGIRQDAEGSVFIPPHGLVYSEAHRIDIITADADCEPRGGCHGHE